jgi:hypothetical protein
LALSIVVAISELMRVTSLLLMMFVLPARMEVNERKAAREVQKLMLWRLS